MNLPAILSELLQQGKPFVAYRLPHTHEIRLLEADTVELFRFAGQDLPQEGFVVVPFDNERENAYLLSGQWSVVSGQWSVVSGQWSVVSGQLAPTNHLPLITKHYQAAFNQIHKAITRSEVDKVVLARQQPVEELTTKDAPACFLRLCEQQASTFNYLLSLPEVGVWVGASPELLLRCDGQMVETVALAGTKRGDAAWNAKEVEEQSIVADYIAETLAQFGIDKTSGSSETVMAGGVAHLQTIFRFPKKDIQGSLGKLAEALHPTPAVCGEPKQAAKQLILAIEPHERSLYAGFLGTIENEQCAFYVNIRCLRFTDTGTSLFVGGGITRPSTLEAEWDETVLKAESLLGALS